MRKTLIIVLLVLLCVTAYLISVVLKPIIGTLRPCVVQGSCSDIGNPYDIPSSHTSVVFSAAAFLSLVVKRKDVRILLSLLAFLVGLQRIIFQYHSVYGVMGGVLVGLFLGVVWYGIYTRLDKS